MQVTNYNIKIRRINCTLEEFKTISDYLPVSIWKNFRNRVMEVDGLINWLFADGHIELAKYLEQAKSEVDEFEFLYGESPRVI